MRRYEYVYRLGDLKSETKPQCCFFSVNWKEGFWKWSTHRDDGAMA
jgi:hypothetical protein